MVNHRKLELFIQKKYFHLATLMYGFETTRDFIKNNPMLIHYNDTKISLNSSLTVFGEDLSMFIDAERIDLPYMQELIFLQHKFNPIVEDVNQFIKKNIHSGSDYITNRSLRGSDGKILELLEPMFSNVLFSELTNFVSSNPDTLELTNQASYII